LPQQVNDFAAKWRAVSREIPFSIENRRDLRVHFVFGVQVADTPLQIGQPGILVIGLNIASQPMFAGSAGRPGNLDQDLTSSPVFGPTSRHV